MTNKEITELLDGATFRTAVSGCYANVIKIGDAQYVAGKIRDDMQTIIDKQTIQLAEQSAKIYAYEAIIANSNFKAVLPKKQESKK